jgi:hypothetical protein
MFWNVTTVRHFVGGEKFIVPPGQKTRSTSNFFKKSGALYFSQAIRCKMLLAGKEQGITSTVGKV